MTLGVIFGNRDFFPDGLVAEARRDLLEVLAGMGVAVVALTPEQTKLGAVETWQHAVLCGTLLREAKQQIDGVLVCLPNFGDEKGVADALRLKRADLSDSGAGLSGRSRSVWAGAAARFVLREDFGVQQPAPVWDEVFADAGPYGGDQVGAVQGRSGGVPGGVPRGEGAAAGADRRGGRAAECVQHDALQREAAGGGGDQREHARSVGGVRAGRRRLARTMRG